MAKEKSVKEHIRESYGKIAGKGGSCCGGSAGVSSSAEVIGKTVGYSEEEMRAVPDGANLGLGCGNPVALAGLREGEVVLDLGSGAGFDAFLAAKKVGPAGRVIGIDMTPGMIQRARNNTGKGNYPNVEFRLGEIERLPVDAASIDVILSNCVINLSPDKKAVFQEAFRVLKPGGRIMISDLVLLRELPPAIRGSIEAYVGCLAGAMMKDDYIRVIKDAGFEDIRVIEQVHYPVAAMANDATGKAVMKNSELTKEDLRKLENSVASIKVAAAKTRN